MSRRGRAASPAGGSSTAKHARLGAGGGAAAGGEDLGPEAGPAGAATQRPGDLMGDGTEAVEPLLVAVVGGEDLLHALLVDLLPGGDAAVVLAAEVAIAGSAVEPGLLDDHLDARLSVAALGGDLDQSLDDARALGTGGTLAGLQVEH